MLCLAKKDVIKEKTNHAKAVYELLLSQVKNPELKKRLAMQYADISGKRQIIGVSIQPWVDQVAHQTAKEKFSVIQSQALQNALEDM